MVLSRRFLRVVALGMVFALGLAGIALAVPAVWQGKLGDITQGNWGDGNCWNPTGVPGTNIDDTVEIPQGSVVTVADASDITNPLKEVIFKGDATLTLKDDTNALTVKKITVEAGKKAVVNSAAAVDEKFVVADTNSIVEVGEGAVLSLDGKKVMGINKLQLPGKGTLVLKTEVTTANDLEITDGGTLVVDIDNALPALTGTPTIAKGNLTLNKSMKNTLKIVKIENGKLMVADGVKIGSGLDGEVELKDKGQLVLSGDLALKELKTALGSKINIADGKTLTVKPDGAFTLNAEIDKGTLSLDVAANNTATLNKNVANIVFNGKSGVAPTLKLEHDVSVGSLDIRGSETEPSTLDLEGNNAIGTLTFVRTTTPLVVSYGNPVTVKKLVPADGATLNLEGDNRLTIEDGTPGAKWNVKMGSHQTDLEVRSAGLLSGDVKDAQRRYPVPASRKVPESNPGGEVF